MCIKNSLPVYIGRDISMTNNILLSSLILLLLLPLPLILLLLVVLMVVLIIIIVIGHLPKLTSPQSATAGKTIVYNN